MNDSIFSSLLGPDPWEKALDSNAPPTSITGQCLALPRQRERAGVELDGAVVLLPRMGIIGVPKLTKYGWKLIVVDGTACVDDNDRVIYPRGGYDLSVSDLEMLTVVEIDVRAHMAAVVELDELREQNQRVIEQNRVLTLDLAEANQKMQRITYRLRDIEPLANFREDIFAIIAAVKEPDPVTVAAAVEEPDALPLADEYEVARHAEKQGCSLNDAVRYFERQGYDVSAVEYLRG